MSRRFGRNQRRRARERIAAQETLIGTLEEARAMESGLREHLGERLREVREELDEAKAMAHGLSVLFPAHSQPVDERLGNDIRAGFPLAIPGQLPPEFFDMEATIGALRYERLPVLLTRIQSDVLANRVHVRVCFNDGSGETGYAINPRDFVQYPRKAMVERVRRIIAPQIAAHLVNQFYKKS